jgi:hypothetical protein
MKNHIAEDLPARKFAPAAAGSAPVDRNDRKENSGKTPEERAKQAVYDIRYKARRDEIPLIKAYTEYMKNSSISGQERSMVKAKLFGKVSGGMRAEDFNPIFKNAASDNVAKALFKVFVEGTEQEQELISLTYLEEFDNPENRKYKVRVTDKNTKRSYVRMATREKINQLRANPNIESVEMTEYGEPYEGERTRGDRTAAATAGRDYDGDGEKESPAKEYRGAVHNAIQRKKGGVADGKDTSGVKEEFIHEAGRKKKSKRSDRLDVRTGIHNKVNTSPTQGGNERVGLMAHNELEGELIAETGYSKFLKKVHSLEEMSVSINQQQAAGAALGAKRGETDPSELKGAAREMYDSMTEKQLRDFAKTEHKGLPEKVKEEMDCGSNDDKKKKIDPRQLKTIKSRMRTTLGLMGIKASYEPEGEVIDEAEQRIRQPRQSANPRGTYDSTGIGQYPRTGKERKKMRKGKPVGKYSSLEREPKPMIDDENPPRRYRDDNPALTARDRNPNLR